MEVHSLTNYSLITMHISSGANPWAPPNLVPDHAHILRFGRKIQITAVYNEEMAKIEKIYIVISKSTV